MLTVVYDSVPPGEAQATSEGRRFASKDMKRSYSHHIGFSHKLWAQLDHVECQICKFGNKTKTQIY